MVGHVYANVTDHELDTAVRWKSYAEPFAVNRTCATNASDLSDELNKIYPLWRATRLLAAPSNASARILLGLHAFHSTGLEGNTLTLPETMLVVDGKPLLAGFDARVVPTPLTATSVSEARNLALLWTALRLVAPPSERGATVEAVSLTVQQLIDLNSVIIRGSGSTIGPRRRPVAMGHQRVLLPQPDEVPALVTEFTTWLSAEAARLPPTAADWLPRALAFACDVHTRFVHVHPFSDGNGRLARTLSGMVLQRFGLPPPMFIRQARKEYMTAVSSAAIRREYGPLSVLHARAIRRALEVRLCVARQEHEDAYEAILAALSSINLQSLLKEPDCPAAFAAV